MIYFDNAATTFPKPVEVYDRLDYIQRYMSVNSGRGQYSLAKEASNIIEDTREKISELVGGDDRTRVIFTPSATIALNEIVFGLDFSEDTNIYISPFEHNAVARPLSLKTKTSGGKLRFLPFDGETQEIMLDQMKNDFSLYHPDFVFITHISNVTGLILPIEEVIKEAKKYGAIVVVDASQSLGLIDIDIRKVPIDFLVFAGHKNLYGHIGVGGFVYNSTVCLDVYLAGGTGSDSLNVNMPDKIPIRFEPASHNILAIASLNASIKWVSGLTISNLFLHKQALTNYTIEKLQNNKSLKIYVPQNREKHISVISLAHRDYTADEISFILDEKFGIATRSGYHCAPFVHDLIGTKEKGGTLRVSLGYFNTFEEIDVLANALDGI